MGARHPSRPIGSSFRSGGTPFLYEGEELGLLDAVVAPDQRLDPVDRDGCRAPVPWTRAAPHGWGPHPWLPLPPESDVRSVEAERADPASVLHLYRRLLALRRATPALRLGSITLADERDDDVIVWDRQLGPERRRVVVSFSTESRQVSDLVEWSPGRRWRVELASDGRGEGEVFSGRLAPTQAVVLGPDPSG